MARQLRLNDRAIHTKTATLDFGSISGGATAELTVTVPGASVSDTVALGPPSGIEAGLVWCGYVSAVNTITIRLQNSTGAPVDPASAMWRVAVIKY